MNRWLAIVKPVMLRAVASRGSAERRRRWRAKPENRARDNARKRNGAPS